MLKFYKLINKKINMTKAPSIIQAAKKRILDKDSSQRSVWLLTYNNEIYNGELFLEIIRPFTEATKNKVKALLFWDELEIASVFWKKKNDLNWLLNSEQIKTMTASTNLLEIKKILNLKFLKNLSYKFKKFI